MTLQQKQVPVAPMLNGYNMSLKQNDTYYESELENNKPQCSVCNDEITWGEQRTSMNRFRKQLCINCQIKEIKATYPPKLAEMSIKQLEQYKH